jgi:tetratricopeptide (TPR) repeat protein
VTNPPSGLARAQVLLAANRPEQALEELGRLSADEANSPLAFRIRAAALLNLRRWRQAADAARDGLAGGLDSELLADLGGALSELGECEEAAQALWQGLSMDPQHVRLLCFYANNCVRTEQLSEAVDFARRAAAIAPHDSLVYAVRIRVALAEGKKRQAQRISEEYLGAYPEEARAHLMHGAVASRRGRLEDAHLALGRAVARNPTDQAAASAAMQTRMFTHPLLLPVRPLFRLGWLGSYLLIVVIVALLCGLAGPVWAVVAGATWVALNLYGRAVVAYLRRRDERRAS